MKFSFNYDYFCKLKLIKTERIQRKILSLSEHLY